MNRRDYVVLSTVVKSHCSTRRDIAARMGYPLSLTSTSLDYLIREGYLDEEFFLTQKTIDLLHRNSPRQAVILAAGSGTRMMPINKIPKALMTIGGEPLIERLINQLHEIGIYNITIVTGYEKERFEYLKGLFTVELVENPDYADTDSLHSLNCVEALLDNCYVINGNVWCGENLFSRTEYTSWYAVRSYYDKDSFVRANRATELVGTEKNSGGNAMCGIAYLCANDAAVVRENLKRLCADPDYEKASWEEALFGSDHKFVGYANVITGMLVMGVNTYEDLRLLDSGSKHLEDQRIELISEFFNVRPEEIDDIHALSSGMTNRLMHFRCKEKEYLMRIPGEGTDKLLSRQREHTIYTALAKSDVEISDKVLYLDPDTGYKISYFWADARSCNPENPEDVKACMHHLRLFHQQKLQVDFRFDLREQLEHYERLRENSMPFADYERTRRHIDQLFQLIEMCPKEECLSHIDAVYDNFLFVRQKNGAEVVRLIDWEYAGMSDPHVDIAMFCIYAYYDKNQIDRTIDLYFDGECLEITRLKIYCYIAVSGLLWTNWCEYKAKLGVKFGAYEMRQYQYAKQFYEYAMALNNGGCLLDPVHAEERDE